MDVKQFIKESIIQIQEGVREASDYLVANDGRGVINPIWNDDAQYYGDIVREIEFDIALTTSESKSKDGGGGLKVAVVDLSGKASSKQELQNVSKVKFSLRFIPPVTHVRSAR